MSFSDLVMNPDLYYKGRVGMSTSLAILRRQVRGKWWFDNQCNLGMVNRQLTLD